MYIKNIELNNFRNYDSLVLDFDEKVNLILGNNAQGKTNLLEAIYISSIGKSFRTNKDSDLVNFQHDICNVKVKAAKEDYDTSVEITIKKDSKKSIKKDGKSVKRTSQLLENILIVIFSPEDLKIVKDEPEKRRKFIDRELCQIKPAYYEALNNYKKALLQRNTYLKEEKIDNNILDLWDMQLASYGTKIITMRKEFISKISDISSAIHSSITSGKESLFLQYSPNIECIQEEKEDNKSEKEIELFFYDEIKKSFRNDIRQRTTTRGPHKDDIIFYVNGINMRSFGSQGQQRTCALSLKLAELNIIKEETGEDAILLLDDVMSELDINRQEYLIKTLKNNQVFVTTTELDKRILDAFPNAKIINIEKGKVK